MLRPFTNADLVAYQRWKSTIDLGTFMSRCAPLGFRCSVDESGAEYRWFVIVAAGRDVGTIWLERERDDTDTARLGIFLSDESCCGKGIGRRAIDQAIALGRPSLQFTRVRLHVRLANARAIRCYRACGFLQIGRGTKRDKSGSTIDYLTMEKEV
jgi:RimJ/RimL family protein N-acetyltransferase